MKKMLIAAVCLMLLSPAYAGASLFGSDGPKDTDEITPLQYASLLGLRDIDPVMFRTKLMPLIDEAMKDGKITVGVIIARAHVGRATFYGLFKSKDDLLAELVRDICTHALDNDGTPLDDPLVQVEHILNNLWNRRQGVRALVAGAGSRVFADCLRQTIMSRAAETVPVHPAGPAGTMDRSFLLHHIASSFVGMVQWWAWHNFEANKADVAKDYLSAIKPLFN